MGQGIIPRPGWWGSRNPRILSLNGNGDGLAPLEEPVDTNGLLLFRKIMIGESKI